MMPNAITTVGVLVAATAAVRAAPAPWVVSQPEAWSDITAEVEKAPELLNMRRAIEGKGGQLEMKVYSGPAGEFLQIAFTIFPHPSIEAITVFEDSARKGAAARGTESSYRRDQQSRAIVSYQTVTLRAGVAYIRRITGIARDAGWDVQATCVAALAVCTSILDSLALDESRLIALDRAAHSSSLAAERGGEIGLVVGSIVSAIAFVWIVIRVRRRTAKRLLSLPD
jgi:hypothetical protein